MNERIEAVVSGRVQLVMFRDFTCRKARGLGLVGEVKNISDGTVHVIAEGAHPALEALVKKLWKGSLLSRVDDVRVAWKPAAGTYRSFKIAYE